LQALFPQIAGEGGRQLCAARVLLVHSVGRRPVDFRGSTPGATPLMSEPIRAV